MKIVESTSTQLTLRNTFAFWIALFVGGSFIAFGLLMGFAGIAIGFLFAILGFLPLAIVPSRENYKFDKRKGFLTIERQKLFKTETSKHLLRRISGVEIQGSQYSRVCLILDSGKERLPLTTAYMTATESHRQTAEAIATFLKIPNYGTQGFKKPERDRPTNLSLQEAIAQHQATIKTNPNDANAYRDLGVALYQLNKSANRQQAIEYLDKARTLFLKRGDKAEARETWTMRSGMSWGYSTVEEADTLLQQEDGTELRIPGGTRFQVIEYTANRLILEEPKLDITKSMGCLMLGCVAPFQLGGASIFFLSGFFITLSTISQVVTALLQANSAQLNFFAILLQMFYGVIALRISISIVMSLISAWSASTKCTFDKSLGRVTIQQKNALFTRNKKCLFREVADVIVAEKMVNNDGDRYPVYGIALVLSSEKKLPLTPHLKPGRNPVEIRNLIASFLDLRTQESKQD